MALWIDPNKEKPDAEITVLMRLDDDEYPVWPGYWDGETWSQADFEVHDGRAVLPIEKHALVH